MLTSIMSSSIVGASEAAVITDCVESREAFEARDFLARVFFLVGFAGRAKTKKEQSDDRRWCSSLFSLVNAREIGRRDAYNGSSASSQPSKDNLQYGQLAKSGLSSFGQKYHPASTI